MDRLVDRPARRRWRVAPALAALPALLSGCRAEPRPVTVAPAPERTAGDAVEAAAPPRPDATPPAPAPGPAAAPGPASGLASGPTAGPAGDEQPGAAPSCEPLPFVSSLPIAEASGSVLTEIDGALTLMVVADSGHRGDYILVDPGTGAVRERGKLPLGGAGDDLEGLAVRGDRFWALTSSGWLRAWVRRGPPSPGFELVVGPVAIGPSFDSAAPARDAMTCGQTRVNCGRNFEGLCLISAGPGAAGAAPEGGAPCVGMAVSKAEGRLYCVIERGDQLGIDAARTLDVARADVLADCNIDGPTLWLGSNLFELNRVRRIDGWGTPARAQITDVGALGVGSGEAITASGEELYRLSDTQGTPSLVAKFRCAPPAKGPAAAPRK